MASQFLDQVDLVAAARWQATEPATPRRERQASTLVAQAEAIAHRRWVETLGGSLAAEPVALEWSEAFINASAYRLYDRNGQTICCHLCGRDDSWLPEGDVERNLVRMFVCEHAPMRIGSALVRQVSTVALGRVVRCETVG